MSHYRLFWSAPPTVTVDGRHPCSVRLGYEWSGARWDRGARIELTVEFVGEGDAERFLAAYASGEPLPVVVDAGPLTYRGVGVVGAPQLTGDPLGGRSVSLTLRLSTMQPDGEG